MRIKKFLISILVILFFGFFGIILLRAFYYAPNDEVPLSPEAIEEMTAQKSKAEGGEISISAYPVRLVIPKINVDTKIQQVGITKKGNMAAPNNFVDAGWYKYGTIPGNKGSAVIAGHVDNGIALPAVFSRISELAEGDDIYITTEDNQILHFSVTKNNVYDFDSNPEEVFTEDYDKLIKLITCTGVWIDKYKTHNKRLVVSAILIEE